MTERDEKLESLERDLRSLEIRISELESILAGRDLQYKDLTGKKSFSENNDVQIISDDSDDKGLESRIGRIGLAWLGIVVLLFGIIFLTEYLTTVGQRTLSSISGYAAVLLIYIFSRYINRFNQSLSFLFILVGQVVLFYVTLRLHFFSTDPLIHTRGVALALLLLVVGHQVFLAVRNRSQVHGILAMLFLAVTALLSDIPHFLLPLISAGALISVLSFRRYDWRALLLFTIFITYISFFLWMFGNPFTGRPLQVITDHPFGYLYLFLIGALFSALPLLRRADGSADDFIALATIIHGIQFTLLLVFVTFTFLRTGYVGVFALVSAGCIFYSVLLKSKSDWKFGSAFFALYGFMAMSVAFYDFTGLPGVYLFLALQSLVVVSMALWYRNRLIIIMNSLLFTFILFIYMIFSEKLGGANFSFAVVSLLSARIINWKKERLSIKTDLIRNLYLIEGFIMVLFSLFHAVPRHFVTISWIIAGLFYFLLSFILENVKYRYMALGTMISAAVYLFIVDLARIELIYRVLALLALAVVSIGISIYYTTRVKKPTKQDIT